jgi:DNA-binding MarR family transcriptional regulator
MEQDVTAVNDTTPEDPAHVAWLLDRVFRRIRSELSDLGGEAPGLRGSHHRLLSLLPSEGATHGDLAAKAAITKQALGQLTAHLEAHGYVETLRDPQDRRVRIVRPTPAGQRARVVGDEAIAGLEDRWQASVGRRRYAIFRQVLTELAEVPADEGSQRPSA